MRKIVLKRESDVAPQVQRILTDAFARLKKLLPQSEAEHIGATSVPGAITKGDVDVVVRVPRTAFRSATKVLSTHFAIKQPENWTKSFASFGDDTGYGLPLGVQLVAKSSTADFLTLIRDYLISNPSALAEYNLLKVRYASEGPEGYWKAKNMFFTRLLTARGRIRKRPNKSPEPTPTAVTPRAVE